MFISEVPSNALDRFKKGKGREFSRLLSLIRPGASVNTILKEKWIKVQKG
jgi:hypothetical protein